jgi:hypothetical protein
VAHPGQDRPAVLMSRLDCEAREMLWILAPAP